MKRRRKREGGRCMRGCACLLAAALSLHMAVFAGADRGAALAADMEAEKPAAQESALAVMQAYNTALPQESDDKYRSFYEVFVYSFCDGDGDGVGDLQGLTEKLDYINDGDPTTDTDLGCDGIWLMPVMPSPTYHKYDVTDYCAIDPAYGTMEDFQIFLDACHARGVRVILDLVLNHSSSRHPWFQEACAYLRDLPADAQPDAAECPYVEYYNFSRDAGGSSYPVEGTGWYYEAPFWSEMPDFNLNCEAVRAEFEKIVSFWLDMGVDGFRLDAAKEYFTGDEAANIEVLTWFNDMVKAKNPEAYLVAEVWNDLETYAKYYQSGIDSVFDFAFADADGVIADSVKHNGSSDASSYGKAIERLQETFAQYSDTWIDAPFYTNHDMGRSAGYYPGGAGGSQTKIAQAMNLFMSGSAFLYYGEELGMKGSGKDENKRAPMYWSEDPDAAGMCVGPPGMDAVKMKFGSFEEQAADGDSVYHFVRQALRLRSAYPAIARGTADFIEELSDENICVLRKTCGDAKGAEDVLLVFNISENAQRVDLGAPGADGREPSLSGVLVTTPEQPSLDGTVLELPMYSVAVLTGI